MQELLFYANNQKVSTLCLPCRILKLSKSLLRWMRRYIWGLTGNFSSDSTIQNEHQQCLQSHWRNMFIHFLDDLFATVCAVLDLFLERTVNT